MTIFINKMCQPTVYWGRELKYSQRCTDWLAKDH